MKIGFQLGGLLATGEKCHEIFTITYVEIPCENFDAHFTTF